MKYLSLTLQRVIKERQEKCLSMNLLLAFYCSGKGLNSQKGGGIREDGMIPKVY